MIDLLRPSLMFKPCVLQDQIVNELASNKVYLQGNDIQGRTVFVVLAKQQEMGRADETKRFICYTLDNAIAAADPARNELRQFVCLFDLAGAQQYKHCFDAFLSAGDAACTHTLLSCLCQIVCFHLVLQRLHIRNLRLLQWRL